MNHPREGQNLYPSEFQQFVCITEGLDGESWYSLITKNLAIYSLSLKFWLFH